MAADIFPPLIAAQIDYLVRHSSLSIKIDQIQSGLKNYSYPDRFTLTIPFCLDYVKWDVVYNAHYPLAAPDIIFGPEDESFHPLSPLTDEGENQTLMNNLRNWNSKDPSKLFTLIKDLRDSYLLYQKKRVGELDDARLKFEISTILSREGIEVCLISEPERPQEVKFAVPLLDSELNKLMSGFPWSNPQKIYLQVVFPVSGKYSSAPPPPRIRLLSSPEFKMAFSVEDVKLPPWVDGMCLAEYLPGIEEILRSQISDAVASIGARRRFIEALAPLFGTPVEADPIFCRKATFLASAGVFTFLVYFSLSTQFPRQQPILVLQSSLHFNSQGTPVMSPPITGYPWSPRWDSTQMAERICEFVTDECINFKKYCNEILL